MSIIIDKEFESLIPPLSAEEFQQLEENCVKDGIRDPLVVWEHDGNDILVDGHNRFRIVGKHPTLQFNIKRMGFADRDAVSLWIIDNQLGKRNLIPYDKVLLQDRKKDILAAQAKKRQGARNDLNIDKKSCQSSEKEKNKIDRQNRTDYKIAHAAGVSEDTVRKVRAIEKSGDTETINKVRKQEISINQGYRNVMGLPPTPPKVNHTKEAEKRHEQFEQAKEEKTVDFQAAIRDKTDVTTIARTMALEIESAMTKMLNVKRLGSVDVDNIHKVERTKESKDNFKRQLRDCIKLLIHLEMILNDW